MLAIDQLPETGVVPTIDLAASMTSSPLFTDVKDRLTRKSGLCEALMG